MYDERVEVTLKKMEQLIKASINLKLPELTNMCEDFLLHNVDHAISACIDVHRVAMTNSLTEIADRAWQGMLVNFQEVSKGNAFRDMSEPELQASICET